MSAPRGNKYHRKRACGPPAGLDPSHTRQSNLKAGSDIKAVAAGGLGRAPGAVGPGERRRGEIRRAGGRSPDLIPRSGLAPPHYLSLSSYLNLSLPLSLPLSLSLSLALALSPSLAPSLPLSLPSSLPSSLSNTNRVREAQALFLSACLCLALCQRHTALSLSLSQAHRKEPANEGRMRGRPPPPLPPTRTRRGERDR